jgi:RimJ/RimL family protein N-acetyltransferase
VTDAPAAQQSALRTPEGLAYVVDPRGLPVGVPLPSWTAPGREPRPDALEGRYCRLEARTGDVRDAALFGRLHDGPPRDAQARWTYIPLGPFPDAAAMGDWLDGLAGTPGTFPLLLLVTDDSPAVDGEMSVPGRSGSVEGTASYMRADATMGTVEVGSIVLSPALQRSRAATEAMSLMARHVFELGYRRYEWKCDALNAPSRSAAVRLGFSFEGVWRNAVVAKGRNRDTAWYAMTDTDWRVLSPAHQAWLDPSNFDAAGRQRSALSMLTAAALAHPADRL